MTNYENMEVLDQVIVGRVTPHIYAFSTNTFPNYLKVGDTYRPVDTRLREWEKHFPHLKKELEIEATISDDVYFRDFAVHKYLYYDLHKERLIRDLLPVDTYYSNEFFRDTHVADILSAVDDIHDSYANNNNKYDFYSVVEHLPTPFRHERGPSWKPRPNQQEVIDNFKVAVEAGRSNLLMYAVMRFGKSFTSLCCAKEIDAKTVLIVSAKADVRDEWKRTVETAGNFANWYFVDSDTLLRDEEALERIHQDGGTAVIFLTLQDLQGEELKAKHRTVFESTIDILIVDETHFGARAEEYGRVLREAGQPDDPKLANDPDRDDEIDPDVFDEHAKQLKASVRLHLSGTPYRILMGTEFATEDIIAFVQFSDIVREQQEWDQRYLNHDDTREWDNPYFGFPQMVRFAFNPNQSSLRKMQEAREQGYSFAMSKLFEPESTKLDMKGGGHKKFKNEPEILDFLRVIDGTQEDENVLGFLDYDKLKEGKMCRHMVMVLPYRASCDAMEKLINDHKAEFENLSGYKVVNISGIEGAKFYKTPDDVKRVIASAAKEGRKTITLTVNRMLTGSTVEQWDTMLFLKDTSSPQEYDQAIFRIQNQYTRTLENSDGDTIKENLKPQTLLVDFDPQRLFRMQEQKSFISNINSDLSGNDNLEAKLEEDLQISPIITINKGKISEVQPTDILQLVSEYNSKRSVADEVRDLPVDMNLLNNEDILNVIRRQSEIGSHDGLSFTPYEGDGDDLDFDVHDGDAKKRKKKTKHPGPSDPLPDSDDIHSLERKLQTYYQRILFYAMLTEEDVDSLSDIVATINAPNNRRIAKNLGLDGNILRVILKEFDRFKQRALDYKIQNISRLAQDETLTPVERAERALAKFTRISDSEVRTPPELCQEIAGYIPKEKLAAIVKNGDRLIDIASKSGEFALVLYQRLTGELGYSADSLHCVIYSIPTSTIAYEFTRKFYEILGLNTDNIATTFTTYDLLDIGTDRVAHVLTQGKTFNKISLDDVPNQGGTHVKFGAVVGNPPYQKAVAGTSDKPIYPYFMEIAYALAPFAVLVTPSRFLFNAGNTRQAWNRKMLADPHLTVARYEPLAATVFPDTDIKGGIAITIHDTETNTGGIGTFIPDKVVAGILPKVRKQASSYMNEHVYAPESYKFTSLLYEENPDAATKVSKGHLYDLTTNCFNTLATVFKNESFADAVAIFGRQNNERLLRWIDPRYVRNHPNLNTYTVALPKSNGSGKIGETLSSPLILGPGVGHTQTFISIGSFETVEEARNLLCYLHTKIARVLLGTLKVTQDNKKKVWSNVPWFPFDSSAPFEWTTNITELDARIMTCFGLNEAEREHVVTLGADMPTPNVEPLRNPNVRR